MCLPASRLQREHQHLHGRKAEKDKQLAATAKRADAAAEQLAAAERLAQEQAGACVGGAWDIGLGCVHVQLLPPYAYVTRM